jgi:hypothetical protein
VIHAHNPSYSEGRDQNFSLKPAQPNSSRDPISKHPSQKKRAGGLAQGTGPEFKPQYHKKKKKRSVWEYSSVGECLPSRCEAPGSVSSNPKKERSYKCQKKSLTKDFFKSITIL